MTTATTTITDGTKPHMVTRKNKGLGRGLDALLGGSSENGDADSAGPVLPSSLAIRQLQPGKYQPRTRMDEGALAELADSIKAQGLLQPILVRPLGDHSDRYEIIAGERRYRAAQIAGLTDVPVLVKVVDDHAAAAMALNPLEEAQGIQRLITEFSFTHERAASAVGRSRSAVSNLLRLLNLAQPVQTMLMASDIDMGHARALLAVDPATQITLANVIIARRLSVRETEKLVAGTLADDQQPKPAPREKPRDIVRLEEELSDALATQVAIKVSVRNKGQLVIDFADLDALDGVIARLRR
jgi:ParB family transcriptional regulator, chromosome partitioning protein